MSQVILNLCDEHPEAERVEGQPYTVTINSQTFDIDLCDMHAKPLKDLITELTEYGRPEKQRGRGPRSARPLMVGAHQVIEGARGVGKTSAALLTTPEGEYVCPEPECGRTFTRPQGLAAHRGQAHNRIVAHYYVCSEDGCAERFANRPWLRAHLVEAHGMGRTPASYAASAVPKTPVPEAEQPAPNAA